MWLLSVLLACVGTPQPCADCGAGRDPDADGDGASTCAGDCDDSRADVGPRGVTPEVCDDVDNDCNGVVDVDDLGAPACLEVEVVEQPARLRLDLLVVIDDTGSMLDEDGRLAAAADALFTVLDGTDTHVGVITNDAESPLSAGRLRPPISGGDRFLAVLDDTPEETRIWWRGATAVGADGLHPDAGFDAAFLALTVNAETFNAGFFRDDADLAIWFVTDSQDNSQSLSQDEFASWLAGVKLASGRTARVDGIIPTTGDPCSIVADAGALLEDLVAATNGLSRSVCDLDWSPAVTDLATHEVPTTQISVFLGKTPIPATLTAELDTVGGQTVALSAEDLTYDPFANQVFIEDWLWTEIRTTTVRYEILPP